MFCRDNVLVTLQRAHVLTRLSLFLRRCRRCCNNVRHRCFSKEDRERSYLSSLAPFASSTLSIGLDYSVARASDRAATACLPRGLLDHSGDDDARPHELIECCLSRRSGGIVLAL